MKHTRHVRLSAAAAALIVAATMGFGSTAAFADDNPQVTVNGTSQEAANPALVNPSADVQLSIHKYLGMETNKPNNGTVLSGSDAVDTATHPALEGIDFDVYQVVKSDGTPVDLTTNAGWEEASKLLGATVPTVADQATFASGGETYKIVKIQTVTTNSTGLATFTKSAGVGVYFVHENLDTSTNVKANGETVNPKVLSQAKDFFVTLPMTEPTDTSSWMYDVHVYPKNQKDSITKELVDKYSLTTENDGTEAVNNKIVYTIKSSITDGITESSPLGMYAVYDNLDPALTLQGVSLELSNGTALAADTDYKVYASADNAAAAVPYTSGTDVANGPLVSIVFTEAGLTKLEAARNGDITVNTTINAFGTMDADGIIPNTASFIPNKPWWDQNVKPNPETPEVPPTPELPPLTPPTPPEEPGIPDEPDTPPTPPNTPGIPSEQVVSKYGRVVIEKYDPAQTGVDMSGAEFAIYWDPTPGDGECTVDDVVDQKAIATGTINNTGKVFGDEGYNGLTFTGLQTSNWYNNEEQDLLLSYCLVETKAPEGYNLDATAHYLTIDYKTAVVGASVAGGAKSAFVTEQVANEKTNLGNKLPLTGGEGVAALGIAGVVLIGGGLGYYMWSRRREEA